MPRRIDADVCVVGAGYAGLTAARRLTEHSKTVVVLEARDRVSGRIWTQHLSDGSPVDRGGAWLAPSHDAIFALAGEVGVSTYKTYVQGAHLVGGRMRRYKGLIPKISPARHPLPDDRATALRYSAAPGRRRRRSSSTTSPSGGPTGSAGRRPSRGRPRR